MKIRNDIDTDENLEAYSHTKKRNLDIREWKRQAKEVCDVIICEAKSRFVFSDHLIADPIFISDKVFKYTSKFPEETLKSDCDVYPFLNIKTLQIELATIIVQKNLEILQVLLVYLNSLKNIIWKTLSVNHQDC